LAPSYGKLKVFCYLTEIGADINNSGVNRHTAVHLARLLVSMVIVMGLLVKGIFDDLSEANDLSPLRISA